MIKAPLANVKASFSDYMKKAAKDEALITRCGKTAAILIGFAGEDGWFDYRLEHEVRFLKRSEEFRRQARIGTLVDLGELATADHACRQSKQ